MNISLTARTSCQLLFFSLAMATLCLACGGAADTTRKDAPPTLEKTASPELVGRPSDSGAALGGEAQDGVATGEAAAESRELVADLVTEIKKRGDAYREEFGVEGYAAPAADSCAQVCALSEEICKASTRICEVAEDNPEDAKVAGKCRWATEECGNATQQCQTCRK